MKLVRRATAVSLVEESWKFQAQLLICFAYDFLCMWNTQLRKVGRRMIDEWKIGKELEGNCRGLIAILSRYFFAWIVQNQEQFQPGKIAFRPKTPHVQVHRFTVIPPLHILISYLLTYLRSWALLEELSIVQHLRNTPAFHGTRRFNTVFTRALHWSLSWAISIQSTPSHILISY
jgi:hypothetical protein